MINSKKIVEVSVVVPVYNEEKNIEPFLNRILPVLSKIGHFEVIFVMDPGTDNTQQILKKAANSNRGIKYLKLSRRFGQSAATMAGIRYSRGRFVVVIDVDLQDPPELIKELYIKANEGYDVVYATRSSREGETFLKKITAKLGYKIINKLSDVEIPLNTGDFRIMSRRMVEELNSFSEKNSFLRGMVAYIGLSQSQIYYKRASRNSGKGNYNRFFGSVRIGMNGLIGFSSKPLTYMFFLGGIISISSFALGTLFLIQKIIGVDFTAGLPTTVILITFLSGIQILSIGVLGEYISRIYDEVKNRPQFIVEKIE